MAEQMGSQTPLIRSVNPPIVPRRDLVASLAVGADAADVGHEDARFAGDVGPGVPGLGLGIECGVCHDHGCRVVTVSELADGGKTSESSIAN